MPDKPISIAYPIQQDFDGFFKPTYSTVDAVKNSIRNLFLTKKGSRPGRPEYGSLLWERVMFEQNTDGIVDLIEAIITHDLGLWLPKVKVTEIKVSRTPEDVDIYKIYVEIIYSVDNTSDSLTMELS